MTKESFHFLRTTIVSIFELPLVSSFKLILIFRSKPLSSSFKLILISCPLIFCHLSLFSSFKLILIFYSQPLNSSFKLIILSCIFNFLLYFKFQVNFIFLLLTSGLRFKFSIFIL